jgi:hypothetical protein
LIDLGVDGPYTTAAMRRDSARILANVASRKADVILQNVTRERVIAWIAAVEGLEDMRLKQHSERACEHVKKAMGI